MSPVGQKAQTMRAETGSSSAANSASHGAVPVTNVRPSFVERASRFLSRWRPAEEPPKSQTFEPRVASSKLGTACANGIGAEIHASLETAECWNRTSRQEPSSVQRPVTAYAVPPEAANARTLRSARRCHALPP